MKKRTTLRTAFACLLFILTIGSASAQEFDVFSNGLIYDTGTVRILRSIVDSLNLQHLQCPPAREYRSPSQAYGEYIELEYPGKDNTELDAAFVAGLTPEDLERKDGLGAVIRERAPGLLFTREANRNYNYQKEEWVTTTRFYSFPLGSYTYRGPSINVSGTDALDDTIGTGRWYRTRYYDEDDDQTSVYAIWFDEEFRSTPILPEYATLIAYSDCLIDTTTSVMLDIEGSSQGDFMDYLAGLALSLSQPERNSSDFDSREQYLAYVEEYRRRQGEALADMMAITFDIDLSRADLCDTVCTLSRPELLESFIAENVSQELALEIKRRREVWGTCSMDERPRLHAQSIAILAAQTARWDVFLRAHLDIMNDRFSRVSDGSYAWGRRKTYLQELEALNINVLDLLIGISLDFDSPAANHYFGSIGRLGRALSESSERDEFEERVLTMIRDERLDAANRIRLYFLYTNYLYNLDSVDEQRARIEGLQASASEYPEFLRESIEGLEVLEER